MVIQKYLNPLWRRRLFTAVLLSGLSGTGVLWQSALAQSSGQLERNAYQSVPLSTLKGTLESGDPTQLPLNAVGYQSGPKAKRPQVKLDKSNPQRIIAWVTQVNLEDDSIRNIRYRVEIVPNSSPCSCKQWKVSWVGRQYQCRAGRGSQEWTTQRCR